MGSHFSKTLCEKPKTKKTKTLCETSSKLTMKKLKQRRPAGFIVNFEQISHTVPKFPLLIFKK